MSFKLCAVILDDKKEVYRAGQKVKGKVILDVTENLSIIAVRVYCYGQTLTKWDKALSYDTYVGKESYFGLVITAFGNKPNKKGPNVTLTAGRHVYAFTFNLPKDGLPSSFEGQYGATRYWVQVQVHKPWPSLNRNWYRGFTILNDINVNLPAYIKPVRGKSEKTVSKVLGLGDAGQLTLTAATDRAAYCPGEKIALQVLATNGSEKDLGCIKACLIQHAVYRANNDETIRDLHLKTLEGGILPKGESRAWTNQLLQVDALPPTTKARSCHLISVTYHVKVYVEVPFGFNLEVKLPVTIGTIPYRHQEEGATAAAAAPKVTTCKCLRGPRFSKCEGNFPNYDYISACEYVQDYVFKPQSAVTPANSKTPSGAGPVVTPAQEKEREALSVPERQAEEDKVVIQAPPSYDEVVQMGLEANENSLNNQQDNKTPRAVAVLVRFPDDKLTEFRDILEKNLSDVTKASGEIVALAPQPLSNLDAWPHRTSVAMFRFASNTEAEQWLKSSPVLEQIDCDAVQVPLADDIKELSSIFMLMRLKAKNTTTETQIQEYKAEVSRVHNSLRFPTGGTFLFEGTEYIPVRGSWMTSEKPDFVTLAQFEKLTNYADYIEALKLGANQRCETMKLTLFEVTSDIVFKSEDLSAFQGSHEETSNSDQASDNNEVVEQDDSAEAKDAAN